MIYMKSFVKGNWNKEIDVRDFIQRNYTPYEGDSSFLEGPTDRTIKVFDKVKELFDIERKNGGNLDIDVDRISTISSHGAGYIDKESELIVGLQNDKPLVRSIIPYGGIRMMEDACNSYGYKLNEQTKEIFTKYRKTHNQGVFDVYPEEIRTARRNGVITGLPDAYGRGRIIGDYRRVALYGVDRLIEDKKDQMKQLDLEQYDENTIRQREEIADQIRSLNELIVMGESYGFDLRKAAKDVKEAIQWTYFAYLAATKEQNGAAMSIGRISTFLDIYAERDMANGLYSEKDIQEMMDDFIIKLRMIRFLRTESYNELFSGDPNWITECIGGMGVDGRTLVTKNSYRTLQSLYNLGPAPEPNLTVLWSKDLPENFKDFCSKVSIDTSAIQYESDDLMRSYWGDDYGIACCVSAMRIGKQMQYFGARVNLAKALLYSINGGIDEKSGVQVAPKLAPISGKYLDYDELYEKFDTTLDWLARVYVKSLNIIHYMHDKYSYEKIQMALHDKDIYRTMACGIAGLSVVVDSLAAVKKNKVEIIRNEDGLAVDFNIEGDYIAFGNNDDEVDQIAHDVVKLFMNKIEKQKTYRDSVPTMSILTITSNVVYGKKTGSTPDGRLKGEAFAPGANPMHKRDIRGAVASMNSVAKLPYDYSKDGISYTFSIIPKALAKTDEERIENMTSLLDGYFKKGGHHINVNVFDKELLLDAMDHPEMYPQLTIRVSGYAVNFTKLTREQQLDVINRTFHNKI
ncbi:MAG: formate C-acetyltransferase [Firmicutes bacterium]|jgi:formate C-acetyltransferase|nr:formate C-acetyltransferase [Bacillota bacterium]